MQNPSSPASNLSTGSDRRGDDLRGVAEAPVRTSGDGDPQTEQILRQVKPRHGESWMTMPNRVPELDGIRGIAILLVMLFHFVPQPTHPSIINNLSKIAGIGWCGVDLFFVLSGFLITGILLDSKGSSSYFAAFYKRRAVRILPLYYFAVISLFIILPAASLQFGFKWSVFPSNEQWWYWLHISNWRTAFHPVVYPEASPLWSLAIEEQFYLVWPLVVLLCSPRRLFHVCVGLTLVCFLARNLPSVQALSGQYDNFLYRLTPFRIDALVFGACAALIVRNERWTQSTRRFLWPAFSSAMVAVSAVMIAAGSTSPHTGPMTRFGYTALGVIFTSVVLLATWSSGSPAIFTRVLRSRVLTSFGKYSYAMYVVHFPLTWHLAPYVEPMGYGPLAVFFRVLLKIAETYLAALLLWNCLEKHFLKLKRRFNYKVVPEGVSAAAAGY
jgi:peptidoglycan/LPS O-acetylase OafA/YrhL